MLPLCHADAACSRNLSRLRDPVTDFFGAAAKIDNRIPLVEIYTFARRVLIILLAVVPREDPPARIAILR